MQYRPGALTACVAVFVYLVFRRHRKRSAIKDVPGPVSPSWIFGMSLEGQPALSHGFMVLIVRAFKGISGIPKLEV